MPIDRITGEGRRDAADDYRDAFERLKAGKPTVGDLPNRLSKGTLRINVATVAIEAKRARAPIARDFAGRFQSIRDAIILENNRLVSLPASEDRDGKTTRAIIDDLRKENSHLASECDRLATDVREAKRISKRLQDELNAVLGETASGGVMSPAAIALRSAKRTAARSP